jgi:hypothetical protein
MLEEMKTRIMGPEFEDQTDQRPRSYSSHNSNTPPINVDLPPTSNLVLKYTSDIYPPISHQMTEIIARSDQSTLTRSLT